MRVKFFTKKSTVFCNIDNPKVLAKLVGLFIGYEFLADKKEQR